MNIVKKKKELVKEYNNNQNNITIWSKQMNSANIRQIKIEGQLQLIDELEKGKKKVEKKKKIK